MMKLLCAFSLGVLLFAGDVSAACDATSDGNAVLQTERGAAKYWLEAEDARWGVDGFGWHATAMVWCEGCNPQGVEGGYVWMDGRGNGGPFGEKEDLAFTRFVSSMWFSGFRGEVETLRPVGDAERVEWDGLKTYVRRYRGRGADGNEADVLALFAEEGCLTVRMFASARRDNGSPAASISPFLKGIRVERSD